MGVYQKMLSNLVSCLRRSFNRNRLKCPKILTFSCLIVGERGGGGGGGGGRIKCTTREEIIMGWDIFLGHAIIKIK